MGSGAWGRFHWHQINIKVRFTPLHPACLFITIRKLHWKKLFHKLLWLKLPIACSRLFRITCLGESLYIYFMVITNKSIYRKVPQAMADFQLQFLSDLFMGSSTGCRFPQACACQTDAAVGIFWVYPTFHTVSSMESVDNIEIPRPFRCTNTPPAIVHSNIK